MFEVEDPDMILEEALEVSDPDMVLEPVAGKPRPQPPRRPKPPTKKPRQPVALSQSQMIEQGSLYQAPKGAVKATVVEDQGRFDKARGYDPRLITDQKKFEEAKLRSEQGKIEVGERAFLRWPRFGDPDYDPKGQAMKLGLTEEQVTLRPKGEDFERGKQLRQEQAQWAIRKYLEPFYEMAVPGGSGLAGQVLEAGQQLPGPLGALADFAGSAEGRALAQGAGGTMQSAALGLDLAAGGMASMFGADETDVPKLAPAIAVDRLPQVSPQEREQWGVKFMQGLGSAFPFITAGLLSGGSSGAMALGAASNAGSTYQEALQAGATESDAKAAAIVGAVIGMLEGVAGVGKQAGSIAASLARAREGLGSWLRNAKGNGMQEVVTRLLNNANAKWASGYDPKRALEEGLLEDFVVGSAVHGALNVPSLPGALGETAKWAGENVEGSLGASQYDTEGGTVLGSLAGSLQQMGFKSVLAEAIRKLPGRMTVEQAKAMLSGPKSGVKAEEFEWSGVPELLKEKEARGEAVTLSEIEVVAAQSELEVGEVVLSTETREAKLAELRERRKQLENEQALLREQLPAEEDPVKHLDMVERHGRINIDLINLTQELGRLNSFDYRDGTYYRGYRALKMPAADYRELIITLPSLPGEPYTSGHWDKEEVSIDNPVVHARFETLPLEEGDRMLLQEIQSDWHQEGRELGYAGTDEDLEKEWKEYKDKDKSLVEELLRLHKEEEIARDSYQFELVREIREERTKINTELAILREDYFARKERYAAYKSAVKDAPFKNTWHELAFKRLIKWAADKGMEGILWPTGAQQIDLYETELRQNLDEIRYIRQGDKEIISGHKNGSHVLTHRIDEDDPKETLESLVGGSIAKQLREQIEAEPTATASVVGNDISIGGQAHRLLYDQKLPKLAQQLAKKFGGEYRLTEVETEKGPKTVHELVLSPRLLEESRTKGLPLFTREESQRLTPADRVDFETRALDAGRLLIFSEEGRTNAEATLASLKQSLMEIDPADPQFEEASEIATNLSQAIEDSQGVEKVETWGQLRQFLLEKNLWHEPSVAEILELISPQLPLMADREKMLKGRESQEIEARFYENKDPLKPGTLYVSPLLGRMFTVGPQTQGGAAINMNVDSVVEAYNKALEIVPNAQEALKPVAAAVMEATQKGLGTVNIVGYVEGYGLINVRQMVMHEAFHTGQEAAAGGRGAASLHSLAIKSHPTVAKVAETDRGRELLADYEGDLDTLALELAAYAAGGQDAYIGWTAEEAEGYLLDYLEDVVEVGGLEALTTLEARSRHRARLRQAFATTKEKYAGRTESEQRNRTEREAFAASLRGESRRSGPPLPPPPRLGPNEMGGEDGDGALVTRDQIDQWINDDPIAMAILNEPYVREIARAGAATMLHLGIRRDPSKLMTQQLKELLEDGTIETDRLVRVMAKYGLEPGDLARIYSETVSVAGRILAEESVAARATTRSLIKRDPKRAATILPAEKVIREQLRDLQLSDLGRSLWQRSGDLLRKMILSQVSISMVNIITTTGRLAIDAAAAIPQGMALGYLEPEKYAGDGASAMAGAIEGMRNRLKPMAEVIAGMDPRQLKDVLRGRPAQKQEQYRQVARILEAQYPEIHSKLFGVQQLPPMGRERLDSIGRMREMAETAYSTKGVTDPNRVRELNRKRAALIEEIKVMERREKFNRSFAGYVLYGTEWFFNLWLAPNNWQEFAFRRPAFVGALRSEAETAGLDFQQMVDAGDFSGLTKEMMDSAIDYALTLTYAYNPKTDGPGIEPYAAMFINFMNRLGPVAVLLGEAFPRAIYNGLKFAYETAPLTALAPASTMYREMRRARAAGEQVKADPEVLRRISLNFVGFVMYGMAYALRQSVGGPEWWQLRVPGKTKDGKPRYLDIRRYQPMATMVAIVDYGQRVAEGRATDKSVKELVELIAHMRMAGESQTGALDILDELAQNAGDGEGLSQRAKGAIEQKVGGAVAIPFIFAVNLRDLWAQFQEDENVRKDLRGEGIWGPMIDKLPWFRRGLPTATTMTEPGPTKMSEMPATQLVGAPIRSGGNLVTQELARLGINPAKYMGRDPDPQIDRAQRREFGQLAEEGARELSRDPEYLRAGDREKAALLEDRLVEWARAAKEAGEEANPAEMERRRDMQRGPGRLRRRFEGYDKEVEKEYKTEVEQRRQELRKKGL